MGEKEVRFGVFGSDRPIGGALPEWRTEQVVPKTGTSRKVAHGYGIIQKEYFFSGAYTHFLF